MTRALNYFPLGTQAEQELVAGLCRGEPASYRQLYDRFAPRLLRILQRVFGDGGPQLAGDAVQSTFLIAFQKVARFDGRSSLLTWLTRIAINEARALHRKNSRRPPAPVDEPPGPRTPEQEHGDREYHLRLAELLRCLSEDKRTALLLFEVEGFSVQEIADITGEPRGTILARLARTRAEMQKALKSWSEEAPAISATTERKARGGSHG